MDLLRTSLIVSLLLSLALLGCAKEEKEAGRVSADSGNYLEYSPRLLASLPGEKILFFHAPWCFQCKLLESDIEDSTLPKGLNILKVDYDSNEDLRRKYGVQIQTTLVKVNNKGEFIESFIARDPPTLSSVQKALIE